MAMYMTMVRFTHQEARGIASFCREWQDSAKRIEGLGVKLLGSYGPGEGGKRAPVNLVP